jgi:hypothetical protein
MRPALIIRNSLAGTVVVVGHGMNELISGFQPLWCHIDEFNVFCAVKFQHYFERISLLSVCRTVQRSEWDYADLIKHQGARKDGNGGETVLTT